MSTAFDSCGEQFLRELLFVLLGVQFLDFEQQRVSGLVRDCWVRGHFFVEVVEFSVVERFTELSLDRREFLLGAPTA